MVVHQQYIELGIDLERFKTTIAHIHERLQSDNLFPQAVSYTRKEDMEGFVSFSLSFDYSVREDGKEERVSPST